jgi:hypothetical protein
MTFHILGQGIKVMFVTPSSQQQWLPAGFGTPAGQLQGDPFGPASF